MFSCLLMGKYSCAPRLLWFKKKEDNEADKDIQTSNLNGSEKYRIETFNVIIDKLVTELRKRSETYNSVI